MIYQLVVQPEAESEIAETFIWYETQEQGLGTEFLRAVDGCVSAIQRNPKAYSRIYKQVRRALVRKFPYGILYLIKANKVIVIACFHVRRNPKRWRNRI